jgi:hypothetical protein
MSVPSGSAPALGIRNSVPAEHAVETAEPIKVPNTAIPCNSYPHERGPKVALMPRLAGAAHGPE